MAVTRGALSAGAVKDAARAVGFPLVGLAPAEALDGTALRRWLSAGHAADMAFMRRRLTERLDPRAVLAGARTVIALGIGFARPAGEQSAVASYARGRDYHYAHRDRMKALRKRLIVLAPGVETYACVDTGVAMEKVWAERAGLGWIGKNGLLLNRRYGSLVTLSVMFMDRAVDRYDAPGVDGCGDCKRCLRACPTGALVSPGVVDSRRCLAYHSIENAGDVPERFRRGFRGRVFGCDTCQDVCPWNEGVPAGDPRFEPRAIGLMSPAAVAALSRSEYDRLSAGSAMARPGCDGLRRNALYAIGAARDASGAAAARALAAGDPSAVVRAAAAWACRRLRVE